MSEIPSPPENPFEHESPGMPEFEEAQAETLPEGAPSVSNGKAKPFAVVAVLVVGAALLFFLLFSGKKSDKPEEVAPKVIPVTSPSTVEPPPLPKPTKTEEPKKEEPKTDDKTEVQTDTNQPLPALPMPANPVDVPQPALFNPLKPEEDKAAKEQAMVKMRSPMVLKDDSGSGLSASLGGASSSSTPAGNDPNSQFAANLEKSKVEKSVATQIPALNRTIAQGRIIQATLESAINTDLPAPIRAIVSRDTYAEAGRNVLIPKGSRLIGSYNTSITSGQKRVFVVWTRVIRPDGVDVAINSPMIDGIGQAGVGGQIDTKFQEIFARSLLSSVMNIGLAIGSEKINGGTTTTTSSTTGTQTSGDAATTATTNALNRLGSITDNFIQRFVTVQPTILVDQGTPVNVFVNKDIVFPSDVGGVKVVN